MRWGGFSEGPGLNPRHVSLRSDPSFVLALESWDSGAQFFDVHDLVMTIGFARRLHGAPGNSVRATRRPKSLMRVANDIRSRLAMRML